MIVRCSRVSDHPKAESRQAALKKGWYQDKDGQWVCPKCQRELDVGAPKIEIQQPRKQTGKAAKGPRKRRRLPIAILGGGQAV
jgi:hypothetical protein